MTTCSYKTTYYDHEQGGKDIFKCKNDSLESGYCKFHDEDYFDETNSDELIKLIQNQLKSENGKCIGYRIPSIKMREIKMPFLVYFNKAEFLGEVDFSKKCNSSKIIFEECTFHKEVNFSNSVNNEELYFSSAKFLKNVKFINAEFKRKVDFQSTKFNDNVNFQSSLFKQKVIFQKTDFQHIYFDLSIFNEDVDFYKTKFNKPASFWNVKFLNKTIFTLSEFIENADFHESEFKNVIFQDTIFNEGVNYENCFIHSSNFQNIKTKKLVIFRNIKLSKPENVTINGDLSLFSFLYSDLTRINFGDKIIWNSKLDVYKGKNKIKQVLQERNESNNHFKIYDERMLETNPKYSTLESVQGIYRKLRENYDFNLRYDDAGQFFVREMEVKRKFYEKYSNNKVSVNKKMVRHVFSLLGMYYGLSKYGESLLRPTILAIIIISVGINVFWTEELTVYHDAPDKYEGIPIEKATIRSVTSFFPFYSLDENTNAVDLIFKIVLLPTSGLIFISLRRKLERRFRH